MMDYNSQSSFRNDTQTENKLIVGKLNREKMMLKNNFIVQIIINILIDISYIFAMSLYRWYELVESHENPVWLNFIYIKDGKEIVFWNDWTEKSINYCKSIQQFKALRLQNLQKQLYKEDSYEDCLSGFNSLKIIGIICMIFISFGFVLNIIHCVLLYRLFKGKTVRKTKWYLSVLIGNIFSFCVPVGLYFWVILFQESLKFKLSNFGFCYYICLTCILIYFVQLIYYKITKRNIKAREDMQDLLEEVDNIDRSIGSSSGSVGKHTTGTN